MARWTGISLRGYRRLEKGKAAEHGPNLPFLVNCSLVLRVPFERVAPEGWDQWTRLRWGHGPAAPPSKEKVAEARARWAKEGKPE